MADCSGRFDEKLKAITEEAQEALANLEATLKGGGVKKKGTKRRVDILYDSSGKRLIKTPRRASRSTPTPGRRLARHPRRAHQVVSFSDNLLLNRDMY